MQIMMTLRFYSLKSEWLCSGKLMTTKASEEVGKEGCVSIDDGSQHWYHCYENQCGEVFKNLKIELACDLALPLLNTHLRDAILLLRHLHIHLQCCSSHSS